MSDQNATNSNKQNGGCCGGKSSTSSESANKAAPKRDFWNPDDEVARIMRL